MKVGILAPIAWRTPPEHYGGWELVASNLTEGLVEAGHDVTLFATADSRTRARLEAICPRPLATVTDGSLDSRVYESLHTAHAFEVAARENFDVLHNHTGCFPVTYAKLANVPTVTTLHGSAAEKGSRTIYERYQQHPYVAISNAERESAPNLNYVATVYNGIEIQKFDFEPRAGDYLLVVGRMSPDKGVHLAVQVAQQAGMKLILAGIVPDNNRDYFEAKIQPFIRAGVAEFVGAADHQLKNELMKNAFAFLHLVTYREAFGLTMVEAMACGTPVLGVGLGSVPEVIKPGVSGWVIAPGDENQIVTDTVEKLTQTLSLEREAIRRYAATSFSVEQMVKGYVEVYNKITNYKS